jgi:hypothetical protein
MKLTRANLSIVYVGTADRTGQRRSQSVSNIQPRSNPARPRRLSRPRGEIVARWHVSLATGRVECRWSLDQPPADDYLCAGYMRAERRPRPTQRRSAPRRRPIARVTSLSINP